MTEKEKNSIMRLYLKVSNLKRSIEKIMVSEGLLKDSFKKEEHKNEGS